MWYHGNMKGMKKLSEAKKPVLTILLLAAFAFSLMYVRMIRIMTNSMYPTIKAGDIVVLVRTKRLHKGNIGAYTMSGNGATIVHRVISVHGKSYRFRGDANNIADPKEIPSSAIVGRVVFTIPLSRL